MKKYFYFLTLLILLLLNTKVEANTFIPDGIKFEKNSGLDIPVFKAGDRVNIEMNFVESDFPNGKTTIEYGVARRITQGMITDFEPIKILGTQKSLDKAENKKIPVIIPNVFDEYSTSTYVFYVKSLIDNDPDRYGFHVTNDVFKVKADNAKNLTKIQYANLLHSNGARFPLTSGPTIYDLSKVNYKGVASTTALEIIFKSNSDTVLKPKITFKKLRSDVFSYNISPEPVSIKKGVMRVVIPLPTFDYQPGVYQGNISFDNDEVVDLDFQYITAGDMVTFGEVDYSTTSDSHVFDFDIYGTPIDLNFDYELNDVSTTTLMNKVYATEFVFKDVKGKELFKISKDVDFSTSTYMLSIPNNIKGVKNVYIKTTDKSGKVLYEGNKDVNTGDSQSRLNVLYISLIAIILLLIIIILLRRKRGVAQITALSLLLIVSLFVGKSILAVISPNDWAVPRALPYLVAVSGTSYNNNILDNIKLRFQEDIRTKVYSSSTDYTVMFRSTFSVCSNDTFGLFMGFSTTSRLDSTKKAVGIGYTTSGSLQVKQWQGGSLVNITSSSDIIKDTSTDHHYAVTLPYKQLNLGKLNPNVQNKLYIYHFKGQVDNYMMADGDNVAQDYYEIPLYKQDNSGPTTCYCINRTQECVQGGATTTVTQNSPSCAVSSSCTVNSDSTNTMFTYIPSNRIGTLTYTLANGTVVSSGNTNSSYIYTIPKTNSIQSVTMSIKDSFDDQTTQSTCSIDNTVTTTGSTTDNGTGTTTDTGTSTSTPVITLLKSPSVSLNKGGSCTITWSISNMPETVNCSLTGHGPISLISGSSEGTYTESGLQSNKRFTLTCSGEGLSKPITASTVCRVNLNVLEN